MAAAAQCSAARPERFSRKRRPTPADGRTVRPLVGDLLLVIEEGKVIPVVGTDLLTLRDGEQDMPLSAWLARRLAPIADCRLPGGRPAGGLRRAFSLDGKQRVSAGQDKSVVLWDPQTPTRLTTLAGHRCEVTGIAFSSGGRWLATAGSDHTVILRDVGSRRALVKPKPAAPPTATCAAKNGASTPAPTCRSANPAKPCPARPGRAVPVTATRALRPASQRRTP